MNSLRDTAHVAILHHEETPRDFLDDLCLAANPLDVQTIRRPWESYVQASIEWFIVPAVAIYLLKPFFSAFLTEAGKDSYNLLRRVLKRTWPRFFGDEADIQAKVMTSDGEKETQYSPCLAIFAIVKSDLPPVKFVFHNSYSKEQYDSHIDAIVGFLHSYVSQPSANQNQSVSPYPYIVAVYDRESRSLQIIDDPMFENNIDRS